MTNTPRKDTSYHYINPEILAQRIDQSERAERAQRMAQEKATPWKSIAENQETAELHSRIDQATQGDTLENRVLQAKEDYLRAERINNRLEQIMPKRYETEEDFNASVTKWNHQAQSIINNTR